jgi:hypothetical protein
MERRLKGQLILDFLGVLDADTRISSLGSDFGSDQRSRYRHSYHFGRWKAQYRCFPNRSDYASCRCISRAAWYSGPRAWSERIEKVTVPTFKVMAEVDKYFELSSHPVGCHGHSQRGGNTATLLPSLTSLDVTPARLRLVDVASGSIRSWSVVMMNLPFQSLR